MEDSVTYRFLDIKKLTLEDIPIHSVGDYINGKEYYGTLDTPILDVCKGMYDDMNVTFPHRLFAFKTAELVLHKQTPRSLDIPTGDVVYIYVMLMSFDKKIAFTNTVFDYMCSDLCIRWIELGYKYTWRSSPQTVKGWEGVVAMKEGIRRAKMEIKERKSQDWDGMWEKMNETITKSLK